MIHVGSNDVDSFLAFGSDFDAGKAADAQSSSSDDSDDSDASGTSDDSGGSGDDEYGGENEDDGSSKKRKRKKDKENKPKKKTKKKAAPAKKKGAKMPKKDPNAPKRPLTSFMLFSQKHREAIKAQNPDVSFGQIGKLLGQQWKAIGAEEKTEIEQQAATAKTTYAATHKTYMESDERKQWEAAMMAKFGQIPGVKVKKTKAGAKKKKQKGPKRARGAYAYFMQGKWWAVSAATTRQHFDLHHYYNLSLLFFFPLLVAGCWLLVPGLYSPLIPFYLKTTF